MTSIVSGYNARGVWLAASGTSTNWFSGAKGSALYGSSGNDALWTPGGGGSAAGGLGDDTYNLWDPRDWVIEAPGEGIDTLVSNVTSVRLPAYVENLVVETANGSGSGNALDNIIAGGAGSQTLDGGAGDDILSGGAGADRFIFRLHTGHDVITDFTNGLDQIAIGGGFQQFTSFAAVKAALTQVGADTLLTLSPTDAVLFRNATVASFTAADFALPETAMLDGARQTLSDDFTQFVGTPTGLDTDGHATWQTTLMYGARTLATNKEAEYYTDETIGPNPFTLNADDVSTLDITATPAPGLPNGLTYSSGLISSATSDVQTYGLFEMRAKIPSGAGFWPAFWLVRADGVWPSELDVMESLGDAPRRVYMGSISQAGGARSTTQTAYTTQDLSLDYHTYAVSWRPEGLRWYVDGTEIASAATPADMHSPMYMIANLAVGGVGSWPGPADGVSSRTMSIDFIKAWQFSDLAGPVRPEMVAADMSPSTWSADTVIGTVGNDRIEGKGGNDVLTGDAGADVFAFSSGDGRDVITDFQPGTDKILAYGVGSVGIADSAADLVLTISPWNTVTLAGVTELEPGDIVFGDAPFTGSSGADSIDRSASTLAQSLSGGAGADTIRSGTGDDLIIGGQGDDVMRGGDGADTFAFTTWDGHDRIVDFQSGVDRIMLRGIPHDTVWVNPSRDATGASGLEIDYAVGQSIFLVGVTSIAAGDIVFSV